MTKTINASNFVPLEKCSVFDLAYQSDRKGKTEIRVGIQFCRK